MTTLSLRIPDSIHKQVKSLTRKEHISMNQFISSALSEKIAAYMTEEYMLQRAERADERKFKEALSKIPNDPPDAFDKL